MANPIRKGREATSPWATLEHPQADWEWRILKAYKSGKTSKQDKYSRFFCAVMSPYTYGSYEYGDVYVTDLIDKRGINITQGTAEFYEWLEDYNG